MGQTLAQAIKDILTEINEAIIEIWPSIQITFEEQESIQRAKKVVRKIKIDLRQEHEHAKTLIKFLNSKNIEELEQLGIQDMTKVILELRRMKTKRNLMLQLDNKCQSLEANIQRFHKRCRCSRGKV